MMYKLALLLCCLTLWINPVDSAPAAKIPVPQTQWRVSEHLQIQQLQPGIWMHTSFRRIAGVKLPSNGLIVQENDYLVLIDTAWGNDLTKELFAWIDKILKKPVSRAFITHFHDDRMGGTPVLEARNIPFRSMALTTILGKSSGLPLPSPLMMLGDNLRTLRSGSVEIYYPGPGHTADNLMVWLPASKILFGGCAVRPADSHSLGNTLDADLKQWPESIRRVIERYPDAKMVIPSHGAPGGVELLNHTLKLLTVHAGAKPL